MVAVIGGDLERRLAIAVAQCRIGGVVEKQPYRFGTAAAGGFVQRAGPSVRLVREARVFGEALLDQEGKSPTRRRQMPNIRGVQWRASSRTVGSARLAPRARRCRAEPPK